MLRSLILPTAAFFYVHPSAQLMQGKTLFFEKPDATSTEQTIIYATHDGYTGCGKSDSTDLSSLCHAGKTDIEQCPVTAPVDSFLSTDNR
jgi:hypothetical protein